MPQKKSSLRSTAVRTKNKKNTVLKSETAEDEKPVVKKTYAKNSPKCDKSGAFSYGDVKDLIDVLEDDESLQHSTKEQTCGNSNNRSSKIRIDLTLENDDSRKERVTISPIMNLQFNDLNTLKSEIMSQNDDSKKNKYTCSICKQQLYSSVTLLRHVTLYHAMNNDQAQRMVEQSEIKVEKIENTHQCDICGKMFPSKYFVNNHKKKCEKLLDDLKTTVTTDPYLCHTCGKVFTWFAAYHKHSIRCVGNRNIHEARAAYLCEFCGKMFNKSKNFHQHKQNHIVGNFKCTECDKVFEKRICLATHIKHIHKGVKYQCKYCPKILSGPSSLRSHEFTHEPESGFLCSFCGKRFLTTLQLDTHLKVHYGYKAYNCMYCGKGFTSKPNMNLHLLIHTGVRRHQCKTCGKRFVQTAHLKAHENVHKMEKSFKCDKCSKAFVCEKYLLFHKKIHNKVALKCPTCSKVFYTERNFKKHVKSCEVTVKSEPVNDTSAYEELSKYGIENYINDSDFENGELQVAVIQGEELEDGTLVTRDALGRPIYLKPEDGEFMIDDKVLGISEEDMQHVY